MNLTEIVLSCTTLWKLAIESHSWENNFAKTFQELDRITSPTKGGNANGMDAFRLELCDYVVGCIHPSSLNSGIKTKSEALLNVETKIDDLLTLVFLYMSCVIYYIIATSAHKAASPSDGNAAEPTPKSRLYLQN